MSRLAALLLASLMLLALIPAPRAAPLSAVLGRAVAYTAGVDSIPKWQRLLQRLEQEWPRYEACLAEAGACPSARARAWRELLQDLRGRPLDVQLAAVNRFANELPYRTDPEVWRVSDYWATPFEFFRRSGDCEDYAIAKYVSLRLLGVPADSMRLIVLQDLRRDMPHAVLAVGVGSGEVLLDNLAERPQPAALTRSYYRPYYAASARDVHFPLQESPRLTLLRPEVLRPAR